MLILSVEKQKKSLVAVTLDMPADIPDAQLDGDGRLLIDRKTFTEYGLSAGSRIDDDTLLELVEVSNLSRAKEKALYLLSIKDYSKKELYDKLKKENGSAAAEQVSDRMEELSLIDDERYARRYAELLISVKRVSKRQAGYLMRQKGISDEIAEAALEELNPDALSQIAELIERKYTAALSRGTPKELNRVINALVRKGFSYSDIKTAIGKHTDMEEFYD